MEDVVQRPVLEQQAGGVADRDLRLVEFRNEGRRIGFVGDAPKPARVPEHDDVAHWKLLHPPGARNPRSSPGQIAGRGIEFWSVQRRRERRV